MKSLMPSGYREAFALGAILVMAMIAPMTVFADGGHKLKITASDGANTCVIDVMAPGAGMADLAGTVSQPVVLFGGLTVQNVHKVDTTVLFCTGGVCSNFIGVNDSGVGIDATSATIADAMAISDAWYQPLGSSGVEVSCPVFAPVVYDNASQRIEVELQHNMAN